MHTFIFLLVCECLNEHCVCERRTNHSMIAAFLHVVFKRCVCLFYIFLSLCFSLQQTHTVRMKVTLTISRIIVLYIWQLRASAGEKISCVICMQLLIRSGKSNLPKWRRRCQRVNSDDDRLSLKPSSWWAERVNLSEEREKYEEVNFQKALFPAEQANLYIYYVKANEMKNTLSMWMYEYISMCISTPPPSSLRLCIGACEQKEKKYKYNQHQHTTGVCACD